MVEGVEHPKALTLTVHRLDILKALPERKNPGPQDTLEVSEKMISDLPPMLTIN